MAEKDSQSTAHEETIIPVQPGLARVELTVAARREESRSPRLLVVGAFGVTVMAALAVIFVLPTWVDSGREATELTPPEPDPAPAASAEPEVPVLTEEEVAALRARAEELLAELLAQRGRLEELAAAAWGEAAWDRYEDRSRAGDDAYLANTFQDAVPAYAEALEVGEQLLERSTELIEAALSAGNAALDAGNARLALDQFQLVLGIEADNATALGGLVRAENLPEVLVLVQQGAEFERQSELQEAARAFRQALGLDPLWAPARSALSAVSARIENLRFDTLMSQALAALAAEEFGDAYEFFDEALILRPDSTEARAGQTQAEQGVELDRIELAEARAIAFETVERWGRAVELYRELLAEDPTLAFAQAGLERSLLRTDLEAKLINLIGNPTLLFSDRVLADAGILLEDARGVENIGERLAEQIADLDRLVVLASTPVTVALRSDELTSVTLFRVGPLGTFTATEVQLRPGNYRAQGTRNGYRDVLVDIIVRPGREMAPVDVRCVEPI